MSVCFHDYFRSERDRRSRRSLFVVDFDGEDGFIAILGENVSAVSLEVMP